jgi:ATP-dependent RNA/DNA helicase IGHMBP2
VEPACWEALLRAPRAVLAGDHLQLPPTVLSDAAAAKGLGVTLFERLHALHAGVGVAAMLTVQYRMHASIMAWSSAAMYEVSQQRPCLIHGRFQ